jgi:hypothetical protein
VVPTTQPALSRSPPCPVFPLGRILGGTRGQRSIARALGGCASKPASGGSQQIGSGNFAHKGSHRAVLDVIEHSRFSASDFIGREIEEGGQRFFEIRYCDSPLKFRVLSRDHSYESLDYQFVRMSPELPWWGPFKSDDVRKTCDGLATWLEENLSMYVAEWSAPDLWSELQSLVLFEEKGQHQAELESFTDHEKVEIRRAIQQLARQIAEGFTLTSEQAGVVQSRLDYLDAAVDRLNRFDWSGVLLNTFVSIAIALCLNTEQGKQLYEVARAAFSGLIRLLK